MALSRFKKITFTALVLIAVLAAVAIVAELALRAHYQKIERITGTADWGVAEAAGITYFWDEYHPRLGWTNVPGYRSDDRVPFEVTINSQRLRGARDYQPYPPDGFRRIAVFGDSNTFGDEVDDHQSVPAYLKRYLDRVQVLNFGVHGYSLGQIMLRIEEDAFDFQPDHIVAIVALPMDLARDGMAFTVHAKPVFNLDGRQLRIDQIPVPLTSGQPWLYRHSFAAAWLFGRQPAAEALDLEERMRVAPLLVQRMADRCRSAGVPLTVVVMVMETSVVERVLVDSHRVMLEQMQRAMRVPGVDVLDLLDVLEEAYSTLGQGMATPGGHWGPQGNCVIAGQIAAHLVRNDSNWAPAADPPDCQSEPAAD